MAKGSLRVNGIIVDTDGEIKASTGDSIVIREDDGSAVITVDTNGKTSIGGPMDVGVDDTGHDVKFFGATAGAYMLWDESQDDLIVGGVGRVGIGTTAPAVLAHAHSTATTALYLTTESDSSGDVEIWLGHNYPTSGDWASISFDTGDNLLKLNNSASAADTQFVINDSGNVGIGTTSPGTLLELASDAESTIATIATYSDTNSHVPSLYLEKSHSDTLGTNTATVDDEYLGEIKFAGFSNDNTIVYSSIIRAVQDGSPSTSTIGTDLEFYTQANGSAMGDARMIIKSDGKVGIGTTAPSALTNIYKTSTTAFSASDASWHDLLLTNAGAATNNTVGIAFQVSDDGYAANAGTGIAAVKNGTNSDYGADLVFITRPQSATAEERMRITDDGKVGIGTTAPGELLDVVVDGTSTVRIRNINNSGYSQLVLGTGSSASAFSAIRLERTGTDQGKLHITEPDGTGTTDALTIDHNGNVGIGTSSPDQKLEVRNSSSAYTCVIQVGAAGVAGENREFGAIHFKNNHSNASGAKGVIEAFRQDGDTQVALRFNTMTGGSEYTRLIIGATGNVTPGQTNVGNLGASDLRWATVFSTNALNTSDRNEKKEIKENKLGLDFINALKTKSYKFKDNKLGGSTHYGLIAQDIENVLNKFNIKLDEYAPVVKDKIIDENENERFIYSLAYNELLAPIIKSVQELSAKNDALLEEISSLKNTGE